MLDILYGHEQFIRVDKKVKVTDPVTVIKEGMVVKLDSNDEIVLTSPVAGREDFVWWAFTSANDSNDDRSDFSALSQITMIRGIFIAETDQYLGAGTYAMGTRLASENGLLFDAAAATQVSTTVGAAGVSIGDTVIPVADSTGMYVGDPIVFDAAGTPEYGTILTVDSGTQVTLTAGVAAAYTAGKTFGTNRNNDTVIARALGAPVGGKLQFITLPLAAII